MRDVLFKCHLHSKIIHFDNHIDFLLRCTDHLDFGSLSMRFHYQFKCWASILEVTSDDPDMGQAPSALRKLEKGHVIDEAFLKPANLPTDCIVDLKAIRRKIQKGKLAQFYPPTDDDAEFSEECPICFHSFPGVNYYQCCHNAVCTECFIQMRPSASNELAPCPYCKREGATAKVRIHFDCDINLFYIHGAFHVVQCHPCFTAMRLVPVPRSLRCSTIAKTSCVPSPAFCDIPLY